MLARFFSYKVACWSGSSVISQHSSGSSGIKFPPDQDPVFYVVDFVLLYEPGLLSYHNCICSQFIYYKVTCKLSTYQNIISKTLSNSFFKSFSFFIYFICNTTFHNNQSPSSNSNLLIYMPIDSSKPTKKCSSCKINELLLNLRRRRPTDPKQ